MFTKKNNSEATAPKATRTEKKFDKTVQHATATQIFNKKITVPGFNDVDGNGLPLFLQNGKHVYGPMGVECEALICEANNQAFIDQYGQYYMIVGREFLSMSHKEQLANLAYAMIQNGNTPEFLEETLSMTVDALCGSINFSDSVGTDGATASINYDAQAYTVLSGYVGQKMAKAIIDHAHKLAMNSTKAVAKEAEAKGKEFKGYYDKQTKKNFKPIVKANNKQTKQIIKDATKSEKEAKKAEKAQSKQAQQNVNLDDAAAQVC
jgi:hypothetical protein